MTLIEQVTDIVREASALMDRTGGFEVKDTGARENLVTTSDLAVQHFLTKRLAEILPGAGFLAENAGRPGRTWSRDSPARPCP